jgi:hypothetical protein
VKIVGTPRATPRRSSLLLRQTLARHPFPAATASLIGLHAGFALARASRPRLDRNHGQDANVLIEAKDPEVRNEAALAVAGWFRRIRRPRIAMFADSSCKKCTIARVLVDADLKNGRSIDH